MRRSLQSVLATLLAAPLLFPSGVWSAGLIVVKVLLNRQPKGEHFVVPSGAGDFLMKPSDLRAVGIVLPDGGGEESVVDGEKYISLRSLGDISFSFDESLLTLEIMAGPKQLPRHTLDLMPPKPPNLEDTDGTGGFLQYGLAYAAGNSFDFRSFELTNQLGVRAGGYLFLTDTSYTRTNDTDRFVRLNTSLTRDWRKEMQRLVVGDYVASSGILGGAASLGGVSFSKVYSIDPYFIRNTMASVSGFAPYASDVDVYLNGVKVATDRIAPGSFDVRNISYYGGAGIVSIVLRDPYGREQRIDRPFYFSDRMLSPGLHDYSYNVGFTRTEYGTESFRYGRPAFSAYHNYGYSDTLTAGGRAEGDNRGANLGPQATFLLGGAGIATLSAAGSYGEDGAGFAGFANYSYQRHLFNGTALIRGFSRDYFLLDAAGTVEGRPKLGISAGASYGASNTIGVFSAGIDSLHPWQGAARNSAILSYSRNLVRNTNLVAICRQVRENGSRNEFFLGFNWYPAPDYSVTASYAKTGDADTQVIVAQKNPPLGEGYGFRAAVSRESGPGGSVIVAAPFVQVNAPFGEFSAEYVGRFRESGGRDDAYRLTAAGAVAYVPAADALGLIRPVTDSFGVAQVGNVEGVRVYQNNQEVGRTDASGKVFLPKMYSYIVNQISIEDRDIPIDYRIPYITKYLSPALRSASFARFDVRMIRAVAGTLHVLEKGEIRPAEYMEVKVPFDGRELTFPTGRGGEFYTEELSPGRYPAYIEEKGKSCRFEILVPETEATLVDLGGLVCETKP